VVGEWFELTSTVESHAPSAHNLMFIEALLFDELLCCNVANTKEDCCRYCLGEQRPSRQLGLIPDRA